MYKIQRNYIGSTSSSLPPLNACSHRLRGTFDSQKTKHSELRSSIYAIAHHQKKTSLITHAFMLQSGSELIKLFTTQTGINQTSKRKLCQTFKWRQILQGLFVCSSSNVSETGNEVRSNFSLGRNGYIAQKRIDRKWKYYTFKHPHSSTLLGACNGKHALGATVKFWWCSTKSSEIHPDPKYRMLIRNARKADRGQQLGFYRFTSYPRHPPAQTFRGREQRL
jgi:hypothetical protein